LREATKLAHGGTGDVKTEWFEEIFGRGMEKYERLRGEMEEEGRKQDELLEKIRVSPKSERRAKRVARNEQEEVSTCPGIWLDSSLLAQCSETSISPRQLVRYQTRGN